jgi:serine/threonine protein kinase
MSEIPARIGKYTVLEVIGRGGMGVVYKASDPQIGRFVAIKMITGGDLERFYAEAKSTGNLQCPNIVTVYDMGDHDGDPYLVMEYLEGVSLESIITSKRPMNLFEKLRVIIDVCNGLSYAHQRNVIHRDIKPGNIMVLNDGTSKIVDFGIARIGDRRMTKTNQIIGSLHYMSPEQIQNRPLDSGTDIFSVGVVLYQLLTGTLPFESGEPAATLMKIIHDPPAPLKSYLQNYPLELDHVINRVLAKNRDQRYPSARDLSFDLTRIVEQQRQQSVTHFLKGAQLSIQRGELTKAREQLQQILSIDRQHPQAHRLLVEVQETIQKQQRSEQARQLRSHADEAFVDSRYDDALHILDQAAGLDNTNQDILEFRKVVQAAKARAERLQIALRRAEAAHHAGELDEAKQAVEEALALDPDETQARALQHVIAKQLEEKARENQMRKLLDDAQVLLGGRKITQAFEVLKSAEVLDPGSLELHSLLKLAHAAREQENRKAELARLSRQIEEALIREDYAAASSQAEAGLQKYPREQGLLKLKVLVDEQRKRVEEKVYVRAQFTSASTLLDSGKTFEALAILEKALQRVPGETQLESLRSIIKERLTQQESEDHRRRSLEATREAARKAVATGDFDEAVRILERAKQEFPGSADVDELLQTAEASQGRERTVQKALSTAHNLLADKEPQRAVQLLEGELQQRSDNRILNLLTDARRQLDQFQRGLASAINEGERILRQHGSEQATVFLQSQPRQYADTPRFNDLLERIRQRGAAETLERQLAKESKPEAKLQLAEAALRRNPANEAIEKTVTALREWKARLTSVIERARDLELSLQYQEAAQELFRLRELYPEQPHLEAEILRLTRLDEQKSLLNQLPPVSPPRKVVTATVHEEEGASATRIVGGAAAGSEIRYPRPLTAPSPVQETKVYVSPGTTHQIRGGGSDPVRRNRVLPWAAGVAALALLSGALLHFRHPAAVVLEKPAVALPEKSGPDPNVISTITTTPVEVKDASPKQKITDDTTMAAQLEPITPTAPPSTRESASPKRRPQSQPPTSHAPIAPETESDSTPASAQRGVAKTATNEVSSNNTSGTQAPPMTASNHPSPDLQPQPRVETTPTPAPEPIAPASKVEASGVSKSMPELEAVRNALHSYEDAYASMDIAVLKGVWPSLSKDQVKRLKDGFRGASAVKVNLDKCADPVLNGDTAVIRCEQSMVYTRDGRRQPLRTDSVAIVLRKGASGSWLVDRVQ